MIEIKINPCDSLISRDGRPFGPGQGVRMRPLQWIYPSVLAGSLRTLLGKQAGGNFDDDTVNALKKLTIAGPLPLKDGQLYFPAPKDMLINSEPRQCFALRPQVTSAGEGCNFAETDTNLQPTLMMGTAKDDFKPQAPLPFWSQNKMTEWLINASGENFTPPPSSPTTSQKLNQTPDYLDFPECDKRIHVKIDPERLVGEEEMLFMSTALAFEEGYSLAARVETKDRFKDALRQLNNVHPLGGERRIAHWCANKNNSDNWSCPEKIQSALKKQPELNEKKRVRMVLATPASFKHGWKPGWLKENLTGVPPGCTINLKLIGACIERWQPISGWSLEKGRRGPKPIRRLVPAGSVYFFEVCGDGDATTLANNWLQPVSDYEEDHQDRRDGFGLAIWGIWSNKLEGAC